MSRNKFSILRAPLKVLGLSDQRADELLFKIEEWLIDEQLGNRATQFPYQVRDDFLTVDELAFYRVLQTAVFDWAIVHAKVSLSDLFSINVDSLGETRAYRNKIDRKHIDFLLCDAYTLRPVLGIELNDQRDKCSTQQTESQFVEQVFAAAGLPILHIPVQAKYSSRKLEQILHSYKRGGETTLLNQSMPVAS